jgi:hypothetical protein
MRGGKRPGAGTKPRSKTPARKFLQVRLTDEERAILERLAAREGVTVSAYVRMRVLP